MCSIDLHACLCTSKDRTDDRNHDACEAERNKIVSTTGHDICETFLTSIFEVAHHFRPEYGWARNEDTRTESADDDDDEDG